MDRLSRFLLITGMQAIICLNRLTKIKADILQLVGSGYSPIVADDLIAEPYAAGYSFTLALTIPSNRFTIKSDSEMLKLYDGRMNHNNGWFCSTN